MFFVMVTKTFKPEMSQTQTPIYVHFLSGNIFLSSNKRNLHQLWWKTLKNPWYLDKKGGTSVFLQFVWKQRNLLAGLDDRLCFPPAALRKSALCPDLGFRYKNAELLELQKLPYFPSTLWFSPSNHFPQLHSGLLDFCTGRSASRLQLESFWWVSPSLNCSAGILLQL